MSEVGGGGLSFGRLFPVSKNGTEDRYRQLKESLRDLRGWSSIPQRAVIDSSRLLPILVMI